MAVYDRMKSPFLEVEHLDVTSSLKQWYIFETRIIIVVRQFNWENGLVVD